jgi:PAS domain S-box-containing protein
VRVAEATHVREVRADEAQRLAAVVAQTEDAIITKDRDAIITSWNPGAERMYGYSVREAVGQDIAMIVPPHRKGEERRILARINAGDRIDHYETERLTKDGRLIEVSVTVSPLTDAAGAIVGASVIARNITEAKRLERAQRFLARAGSLLDRSLDPRQTLLTVLELVVPELGELAIVDLLTDDGRIEGAVATVAARPELARDLEQLRRDFPLDPAGTHPVARVLRTGRPEVLPELTEEIQREIAESDEHLEFMRRLRYRSALVAPLQARGRRLGALSVLHLGQSDAYTSEDLALMEELGRRAGVALDNARLYAELGRLRDTDRFLSEASRLLSGSLDYQETLRRLAALAVPAMADWCVIDLVGTGGELERVALEHRDHERLSLAVDIERRYPTRPDAPQGVPAVVRSGRSEIYPEVSDEMLVAGTESEEHLAALRQLGMMSAMVVPIRGRERAIGAITFVSSTPGRHFDADDLHAAEEVGRRAGVAIENARLYSERNRVAQTLQASLLPRALPHVPGVELASRFRPAGEGIEVGGDFYDVFPAARGTWMAAVGDVCGKGADAAALTGLARYTLRMLAHREASPAEVLRQLNQAVLRQEEARERFLTAVLVSLRPGEDRVVARLACAGHPHPLRLRAGGDCHPVVLEGTLLGLFPEAEVEERDLELEPGESLVLYTDGLTDAQAPRRLLTPGDVARELGATGAGTAQELVAAAEELATAGGTVAPRDDIVILGLHVPRARPSAG